MKDRIHRRLSELVARDPDSILQDNFYTQRSQRYVVPVKAEAKSRFQGIVHDASSSGQTVFIEPQELVEPNNQLKLTEAEIEAELKRVLFELSRQVKENADALLIDQEVIAHLDVVRARARLAIDLKAARPRLNDKGEVLLKQARHPLLALSGHPVVGNDLELGRDFQTLLVSGPNTGGKTVGLTLLGLFALMTRAGLFLPAAPDSEMAVFREVFAVIGDEQDLSRDLSSFSAHLQDIIGTHRFAGFGSLVLLDELMSPTDPEEGSALAAALLASLRDRGARVLATTHLPALKSFAHRERGFMNASFSFDPKNLSPNYKLVIGVPGRSLGIDMARRLGLDKELVRKARSEIDLGKQRMESLITELYDRLSAIEKDKRLLEQETEKAAALVREYEALRKKAVERERELRLKSKTQVRSVVTAIEEELNEIMKPIRAQSGRVSREEALSAREKVRKLSERVSEGLTDDGGRLPDWSKLRKGGRVQVLPLMVEAELLETPRLESAPGDRIKVRIGKLAVMVEAEKIRVAAEKEEPVNILKQPLKKKKKERKAEGRREDRAPRITVSRSDDAAGPLLPQSMRNTLDLRGLRYHEAEAQVEEFLDRACRDQLRNVFIIHGHGTGALKQMVRELLAQSSYVESFRPGEKGEGGDGATVAILKELGY